jgi:hypothetical protein
VLEAHKSGLPHYHALIHEYGDCLLRKKRMLEPQWTFGYSNHRLVNEHGVTGYVTKYLSKASNARVRASRAYGQGMIMTEVQAGLGHKEVKRNV